MFSVFERKETQVSSFSNELCFENYYCSTDFARRFEEDKVIFQDEEYILLLDGIVLNKKIILSQGKTSIWADCLLNLYKEKGEQFFSALRGNYSGALYDKKANRWVFFRDHLGSIPMYYSYNGKSVYVSTSINDLYLELKKASPLKLNPEGIKMVLDLGITFDGVTIASGVRMLHPGAYLVYENGYFSEKIFYQFKRAEIELPSESEYVDMIDEAYYEAIRRQFAKDDEYGYKIISCLSGGIDSRMTVWVSHNLGWKRQLNITFSNSGWYDETTARQISFDLRHEWLFKRLEDAQFLNEIDETTKSTGGNRAYMAVAHMASLTSLINYDGAGYGVLHTGSQGEILKGEAVGGGNINKTSNFYLEYLKSIGITSVMDYSDPEITTIINKYLFIEQLDTMSPLLELDFFEKTLQIPSRLRKNEYLYRKWVTTKYPEMNRYTWATTGAPYGSNVFNPYIKACGCYLRQLPKYINYKLGKGGYGMNPWNSFISINTELLPLYKTYDKYCDAIPDEQLRTTVRECLNSSIVSKVLRAVSLLSAVKLYF